MASWLSGGGEGDQRQPFSLPGLLDPEPGGVWPLASGGVS